MPPKKGTAKKLHELAPEVKAGYKIVDSKKRTFVVEKQFATGGFGRIYTCNEEGKSETLVIKIEPSENGPLFTEVNIFQRILRPEQIEGYKKKNNLKRLGLPWIISCGIFVYNSEKLRYIVIPKYAISLETIREMRNGQFNVKETMEISSAVLKSLEYVHEMGFTHADIKAGNILLEKVGDYSSSVLVDFGLARLSVKNEDKPDKKRAHSGTCLFTSIDAHRGCYPSYRGDVEILAYNVIYWLTGTLPWAALESSPEKTYAEKQKFVSDVEKSVKNALKEYPSAIESVLEMFQIAKKTAYSSKVSFEKLFKMVENAASKSVSKEKSAKTVEKKEVATPKRGGRRNVMVESESDPEEEKKKEEKEKVKKSVATPKKKIPSTPLLATRERLKATANSRKRSSSTEHSEDGPSPTKLASRIKPSVNVTLAKKIEKKYKRLSQGGRGILQPVVEPIKSDEPSTSEEVKKTPQAKTTMRTTSGLTSSTKASATKLRNVPGVRNFPKGRRSIIIKETVERYSKRLQQQKEAEEEEDE